MLRGGAIRSATLWWWGGALLIAAALKHHYSVASAAELDWMLRPLALLLQLVTGQGYQPSDGGEWQSAGAGIVLVKACAGINFMIMSFIGWCWLLRPVPRAPLRAMALLEWPLQLLIAMTLAWTAALLVNTARILLVLAVGPALDALVGAAQVHRMLGLLVYLPALSLQLLLAERRSPRFALLAAGAIYLAMTLVTPLLTGEAYRQPVLFRSHALTVLASVVPLLLFAWHRARHDRLRRSTATRS